MARIPSRRNHLPLARSTCIGTHTLLLTHILPLPTTIFPSLPSFTASSCAAHGGQLPDLWLVTPLGYPGAAPWGWILTVLEKFPEKLSCSPFILSYPLALLTMNRKTSDKQPGAELLHLWFCCTPKCKFPCKAIIKMALFQQIVEKILCKGHQRKTATWKCRKHHNCTNMRKQLSGLLTLKPSDISTWRHFSLTPCK